MTQTGDAMAQIAQVEQATGIARATLRMWERRYGFPQPERNESDERIYAPEQIEKLRLVRLMMDQGLRPGRLLAMPIEALRALAQRPAPRPAMAGLDDPVLQLLRRHQQAALLALLREWCITLGLERLLVEKIAPLNALTAQALACGDLQAFEAQVYAESLRLVLGTAIFNLQPCLDEAAPRVVLAPMGEPHGPGVLMAQALLALERCACVPLGARLPAAQIAAAVAAFDARLLVLSCAPATAPKEAMSALVQLRHALPAHVDLWHVGSSKAVQKISIPGVMALHDPLDIRAAIANYRTVPSAAHTPCESRDDTGTTPLSPSKGSI